ncbi:tyrosine recombinase XerD [Pilimelia anulata]|uniref:Tyrosine recombinase XerD n=1 Tax=Pilimelia anulata TaxID=53371 RepID=A0A8J3BBL2_9ACTN|nr:tyrosine-type recombinase/integrase [Pilimelia anulata]GGK08586.1 tyrosine recombinase XerD [Pilimelia anulata]
MVDLVPAATAALAAAGGTAADIVEAWLLNRRLSPHTRAAYRRDVTGWLHWCAGRDLDPRTATFLHVNAYARELETTLDPRTGNPLTPTTVARKLSALSSWYTFLHKLNAIAVNPVAGADRPRLDRDHSATVGLSADEVDALLAAARQAIGPTADRTRAAITLLADLGLRVSELTSLNCEDLSTERGHRSIRFTGKGGHQRRRALTPGTAAAVDAYLTARGHAEAARPDALTGPLLVTKTGRRLDRHAVFRLIRDLARAAGIPHWASLSPHSLRHAFATTARDEGVPLEDVQDAMGHADPRTTRRYDRDRHNLDRDPAYAIWAARARRGNT